MLKSSLRATASVLILSSLTFSLPAAADDAADAGEVREVIVLGKRIIRESAGATGLDLSLRETPQSVTIVSAQQMKEFALTEANQLLATLPGINVEASETDRTYYNSRGFDVVNFQVDGVGQPLDWGLQTGALDVAIYDRIEAVRGANGMMTGTGNPSATINYIRKRPTEDFRANLSASYGTWDNMRLTGDVSGPLNADGTVRGRFVYANTDTESYLDYYGVNRNVFYGVLTWDITEKLNATVGHSKQDNLATGNNWGALPLVYTDGTPINYDVSANSSASWTYWDTHNAVTFGELSYAFDNGWTVKGVYTYKDLSDEAKLVYAYNYPDKTTGLGVAAAAGYYPSNWEQHLFDVVANGSVSLFGREHEVVLGFNTVKSDTDRWAGASAAFAYPAYQGNRIVAPAEPAFATPYQAAEVTDELFRAYAAIHLNFTDRLKGIVGLNSIDLKTDGVSYGVTQDRDEKKVSPYAGVVYDLNTNVSLYASYSDIFNPQAEVDINRNRLPSAQGKSYEAGVKSEWFERRLYATASVFKSEQSDLAEFIGYIPNTWDSYYEGIDTIVKGYEFEVSGKITPNWSVNGGWTDLSIEDSAGNDARLYLPRQSLKIATTYSLPEYRDLKLGGSLRWQSDTETTALTTVIKQEAYSVVDLFGSVKVTDKVRASLNIKNAFDEKYWGGLRWGQSFYAAPRSAMVTLDYTF
ncbi:TonB-dependent siderophore receptor [Asticcacaulis machinosus]|uniref:TonB-dependent siderophore receptor n=1 Tax=Asticcacaulis machinosus TaxID=2984211 RepID=A0ABT5HHE8_9CAUL|nr:TonB-dependent siderophore receptor [Asticcacaulis machinosus]MDC7675665.1 TonB-dependent siderophore receptor [Asticcacaulis machinosus]